MANIQSAKKRVRQNVKRRQHNSMLRSRMRTAMKKVLKAVKAGDKQAAEVQFRAAMPVIDTMVTKGQIKRNRAAKYKRRLNSRLREMA